MMFYILTGGMALTVGDILMKQWVNSGAMRYLLAGMIVWFIGLCGLAASLKGRNIAVASIMLVLFNVVTLALIEWLYWHNPLSWQQIVGLLLASGAVILLE